MRRPSSWICPPFVRSRPGLEKENRRDYSRGGLERLALAAFIKRPQADAQIGAIGQSYNGITGLSMKK
jgi:hypothetical protein